MTWADDPETVRLAELLRITRATEHWLRDAARNLADVEIPCMVRALQYRQVPRKVIAELLARPDGSPLSIPRVDQVTAAGLRYERAQADQPPPSWFTHPAYGPPVPPAGYNPLAAITSALAPPLPPF